MLPEQGDGFMLDDQDRLPWLEPAEPIEDYRAVPLRKLLPLVLLGLVLVGMVIGIGWWIKSSGADSSDDGATLIEAPAGPYRIAASDPAARQYDVEGKNFEGEGDAVFDASAGGNSAGRINPARAPEMPLTDLVKAKAEQPKPVAPPAPGVQQSVAPKAPPKEADAAVNLGAAKIQLGAYFSKAMADQAWSRLIKRFDDLGTARHSIEKVVLGGKTYFRLRLGAADNAQAAALCGRLRVAGENCWVVP